MVFHLCPEKLHKCVLKLSEQCAIFWDDHLRGHMPRFSWKIIISQLCPWKHQKCMLKPSQQGSFFQDNQFKGSHAYVYSKNECFTIYLLRNPINVCWNPQNRACFVETIDLRGHMPRFTLKVNIFPYISWETLDMCVETLRTMLIFPRGLILGVTCLGLL